MLASGSTWIGDRHRKLRNVVPLSIYIRIVQTNVEEIQIHLKGRVCCFDEKMFKPNIVISCLFFQYALRFFSSEKNIHCVFIDQNQFQP
jgi:hypothetical protein